MPRRVLKVAEGLSFIPGLRWVLWGLLALAAALTAFGLPEVVVQRIDAGAWPRWLHLCSAVIFGVFLVTYAVYRFSLVRAGRYDAGKAFLQIGLGALVLVFLLPPNLARYREAAGPAAPQVAISPRLKSTDPAVRALACEALAARGRKDPAREEGRALAQSDPDPRVRAACARVR